MFEKYRDSIKRVATLAKIQNVKEASHHPIFKDNWETFSLMFLSLCCCCGLIPKCELSVLPLSLMGLQILW